MIDDQLIAFANMLADAARAETLSRFGRAGSVANKDVAGGYDPVTEADVAAETAMRALIREAYPDQGIQGEEMPDLGTSGSWTWSLDPIDGTRSFVCGLPTWTTLIALVDDGAPVLGVIDAPRLDERYVGCGDAATLNGKAIAASGCAKLAEARLASTDPALFSGPDADAFARVRKAARVVRYGHDGYAYARLAAGTVDVVMEAGLKPFDLMALIPVVRGAGGVIGDWSGGEDWGAGRVVATATRQLFDETLALLSS